MPDAYRVVISTRVSEELQSIYHHIAQDSPQNAAAVVERLLEGMDSLEAFPHRYPVVSAKRKPRHETRLMPVRPYLVYYRVVVLVVAVAHGARRRPRHID